MTTPSPGWYPDPQRPDLVRWYDGTAWTPHVQPALAPGHVPGGQAPVDPTVGPRRLSGGAVAAIVIGCVVGGIIVVGILAAIAIPVYLNQQDTAVFDELVSSSSCEEVADEAIRISHDEAEDGEATLDSIRDVEVVVDDRADAELPGEGESTHLLTCRGVATWDDGWAEDLVLELTVDSDLQRWIDTGDDRTGSV